VPAGPYVAGFRIPYSRQTAKSRHNHSHSKGDEDVDAKSGPRVISLLSPLIPTNDSNDRPTTVQPPGWLNFFASTPRSIAPPLAASWLSRRRFRRTSRTCSLLSLLLSFPAAPYRYSSALLSSHLSPRPFSPHPTHHPHNAAHLPPTGEAQTNL